LVVALVFTCASMLAHPASSLAAETMTWDLTQGTAVQSGKAPLKGNGLLTAGHVKQAAAQSRGPARVDAGKFTINYTIQEKAGKYILRGAWDITKEGVVKTSHHSPDSVKGVLYAELPFNPATTPGSFKAKVLVAPMLRQGGEEVKAHGTFTGNEKFEGTLSITKMK
jgi:spore coat protein U-like protein